jgi:hypothetical protein
MCSSRQANPKEKRSEEHKRIIVSWSRLASTEPPLLVSELAVLNPPSDTKNQVIYFQLFKIYFAKYCSVRTMICA